MAATNLSDAAYAVFTSYNREASGKPEDHHMLEAIAATLRAAAEFVDNKDASEQLSYWATELEEFGNR